MKRRHVTRIGGDLHTQLYCCGARIGETRAVIVGCVVFSNKAMSVTVSCNLLTGYSGAVCTVGFDDFRV